MQTERSNPAPRLALAAACAAAVAGLSACYVVPIDPRTGQAYPVAAYPAREPASVTVVAPPAPSAPPQPGVLSVRLYPLNPQANQGGLLTAIVVDSHTGRGTFTLAYLGDTLQGEATRVDANYAAFGRLHIEVLGSAARNFSGRRGIANAFGSKGVNVQCEYLISGPTLGTGVCLFSDGAKYQMHFG
ncbi:hypothetical protein [uncultured Piscinibacter sp.]|uniref:hypothetical protein n=1 Tax=uncultured Piscinibacter sp. TaxID=1131835 RepID=UPI00260EB7B6|nr:hypothetical protein [uncultured Piscinibacter sp.]